MEIDKIFNRLQIGRTHIWLFVSLCIVEILNSYQIVIISLISPYLKKQWNLKDQVQDIPLLFYLGMISGSIIAGELANYAGRKQCVIFGLVLELIGNSFILLSEQFSTFLVNLFIMGVGIGMTLITASTLCSEMLPETHRGRALLFLNFVAIAGKLSAILFTYQYHLQDWKSSQIFPFAICLVLILAIITKVPESTRMLLAKGKIKEACIIFEYMFIQQKKTGLTEKQRQGLIVWVKCNQKQCNQKKNYGEIFKKKLLKTTVILSLNWFIINFLFYGQLFIMPFMFQKDHNGVLYFTYMICGEIPSIIFTTNMIDNEKLGRRYSLGLFFLFATLLNFSLVYYNSIFIIAVARMTMKSIFQILYPLTAQSYPTPSRTLGLAFSSGIGRIGCIIMPLIIFPLYQQEPYYVFVIFMGFSMLGLYSSLAATQTLHKNIDQSIQPENHDQTRLLPLKEQFISKS